MTLGSGQPRGERVHFCCVNFVPSRYVCWLYGGEGLPSTDPSLVKKVRSAYRTTARQFGVVCVCVCV